MAQIQFVDASNAAGIKLTDTLKLKGHSVDLEFDWEFQATVDCDPKAKCLDKFRVYFGQAAGNAWNKALEEVRKKVKTRFEEIDTKIGKFITDVNKYRVLNGKKAIEEEKEKYSDQLAQKLGELLEAQLGKDFLSTAQEEARKRILKEGTKLNPSKIKIVKKVLKVVLVLTVVAVGIAAAAASHGAAVPLLISLAAWVSLTTGALKKLVDSSKTLTSLKADFQSDVVKMEKQIAELEATYQETVKFANALQDKADAIELESDKLKKAIKEAEKSLEGVDVRAGGKAAEEAKELQKKIEALNKLLAQSEANRVYAEPLRNSFVAFRKVKLDQKWGTKLDTTKEVVTALDYVAKGLEGLSHMVK